MTDLATWQRVVHDAALLAGAAACDPTHVAQLQRLRKHHAAADVAVAVELVRARRIATSKFGLRAAELRADPIGVEQASSLRVAGYKSSRFAAAGVAQVDDLGCGIGGDAMGFAAAGLGVRVVDRDPVRAWMAAENSGGIDEVADVTVDFALSSGPRVGVHLDPARRNARGRVFSLADHEPSPAVVSALVGRAVAAAVKLSPAVQLEEAEALLPGGELDFISDAGRLVQAVLWCGAAAVAPRRATLLDDAGAVHQLVGEPVDPAALPLSAPRLYLWTVDPAAERAGLLGHFGLPLVHPRLGLLTGDDLPELVHQPWLTPFEFLAELPFHPHNPQTLSDWLAAHDGGVVEVKTRGKAVDPDHWQPRLRGLGSTPYTLFILRHDQQLKVYVTRRHKEG